MSTLGIICILVFSVNCAFGFCAYFHEKGFKKGVKEGKSISDNGLKSELGFFHRGAVDRNYGRWEIREDYTGLAEFKFIEPRTRKSRAKC